ncbi:hypothetical protein Aab01nite_58170 [Paractinoplanes abujensis]|uniref:AraC-like DNA-binding protein n=1 Tax=Paractinoplanes abujensis TaxID=882441 RepID=A0A7W7G544_9ACTN|nr:helix-turn-helix transcriptional regulator [Actinoplanes abujensis]MBB4696234.1 AraC-like DNA-binding protein [Actinoplanes abujensis]GID22227.1 hypothetical protein Aab01nite_58170 [Actinoplanes abujensis]
MTSFTEMSNAEAVREVLATHYGVRRVAMPTTGLLLGVGLTDLGPLQLHRATWGMTCTLDSTLTGQFFIGHVRGGTATYSHGHRSVDLAAGDAYLAAVPDQPISWNIDRADLDLIAFDTSLIHQVADTTESTGTRTRAPFRFTGFRPTNPHDNQRWLDTHHYARQIAGTDGTATPPLLLGSLARLLAATALTVFPNTALTDPTIEDRRDAHPDCLRRAIAFIDDNAHRDISPADIAAAAHVTIRTIQLAFRRHLDTTPTAYLRHVRLHHAHHDLRAADSTTTTVSAVAQRWGFGNHSRFTAAYHHTYGTTPSRTLRD